MVSGGVRPGLGRGGALFTMKFSLCFYKSRQIVGIEVFLRFGSSARVGLSVWLGMWYRMQRFSLAN